MFLGWSLTEQALIASAADELAAGILTEGETVTMAANGVTVYAVWALDGSCGPLLSSAHTAYTVTPFAAIVTVSPSVRMPAASAADELAAGILTEGETVTMAANGVTVYAVWALDKQRPARPDGSGSDALRTGRPGCDAGLL